MPGGHVYIGLGGSWAIPVPSNAPHEWTGLHRDAALSLELAVEIDHWFAGASIEAGGLIKGQPLFLLESVRAGWIFGSGSFAPYLAAGIGSLTETVTSSFDQGASTQTQGAALIAETGILLLRDLRYGRESLLERVPAQASEMGWSRDVADEAARSPRRLDVREHAVPFWPPRK